MQRNFIPRNKNFIKFMRFVEPVVIFKFMNDDRQNCYFFFQNDMGLVIICKICEMSAFFAGIYLNIIICMHVSQSTTNYKCVHCIHFLLFFFKLRSHCSKCVCYTWRLRTLTVPLNWMKDQGILIKQNYTFWKYIFFMNLEIMHWSEHENNVISE